MKRDVQPVRHGVGCRRVVGCAVVAIGLTHFAIPSLFDPINRLGFPGHTRTFTYVNGGIEAVLGALLANRGTQRQATILSVLYVLHLVANIFRVRATRQPSSAPRVARTS